MASGLATAYASRTGTGAEQDLRIAAIDIGSNTLHMVITRIGADGALTELWRVKETVGLGRMSFPSHRLSREAMDHAIIGLRRFLDEAERRGCEKVLAAGTSAVREAQNGGDFIERIRGELALNVRVVSGKEEARLIGLGVRQAMDLSGGPHLIVDVGGGSVELIVASGARTLLLESRKLGAARMTAQFVKSDPIGKKEQEELLAHYAKELGPVCHEILALKPTSAIGTSGTLEDLAAMCCGDEDPAAPLLDRTKLTKILERLLDSTAADRQHITHLAEHRREQIVAGALLVDYLLRELSLKQVRICHAALREGMIVDYVERHLPELTIRRQIADPRRRSVLELAHRFQWEQAHGEHVAKLCLRMFDQLRDLHGLGNEARELIEYAALLHDVGWHISQRKHHKHSMYLILEGGLRGFAGEEVATMANIARYHRRSLPSARHPEYDALSPRARRIVRVGGALLRLADGLDRSRCGAVSDVKCVRNAVTVRMQLQGRGDCELEMWAARRKADLFVDVFDRDVTFERSSG